MIDEIKKVWNLTPWYFRIFILVFVPILLLDRVVVFLTQIQQSATDRKADAQATALRTQESNTAVAAAKIEGSIESLEAEKAKLNTEETDDATEFIGSYHPPSDPK